MTESPFTSTAAPTDSGQADPRVDSEGTLEHLRPGDLCAPTPFATRSKRPRTVLVA